MEAKTKKTRAVKRDLTTGQVAKIAGVAPRTVSKWIDSGELRGYRIPMGLDRRVRTADLRQFLDANGMGHVPTPGFGPVLFVGFPKSDHAALGNGGYDSAFAMSSLEAGVMMATGASAVVIDGSIGRIESLHIAGEAAACGSKVVGCRCEVKCHATFGDVADAPAVIARVLLGS